MTEMDFQTDLGQGSVLKESSIPLTDAMERHAAVSSPTAMSAKERLAHAAVTFVDSVFWTDRACSVGRRTLTAKEQVQVVIGLLLPLTQVVILTLD